MDRQLWIGLLGQTGGALVLGLSLLAWARRKIELPELGLSATMAVGAMLIGVGWGLLGAVLLAVGSFALIRYHSRPAAAEKDR